MGNCAFFGFLRSQSANQLISYIFFHSLRMAETAPSCAPTMSDIHDKQFRTTKVRA